MEYNLYMIFRILPKIIIFILFLTVLPVTGGNEAAANPKYASIIVDAETGKVLRSRNANKLLYPASLTKIMTLYMAFDALSRGQIRLKDRIYISKHAAGMEPSKLHLPVGSSIKVEDAIYALVTKSANDVAAALGEHLAGSEWAFANKMTSKARSLGMTSTTFKNASGLPHAQQKSTARDMAILARALIYNHPQYYHYFSTKNFKYRGNSYRNHNRLMSSYEGMDGIKTGYIHASGFNLVASAVQNNRRLVGVVFGGRSGASRNAHMEKIMDEGFVLARNLPPTRLAAARVPTPDKKPNTAQFVVASLGNAIAIPAARPANNNSPAIIDEILGQGDVDPKASDRLEAGLMAIAAHTGRITAMNGVGEFGQDMIENMGSNDWAVQIGAYSTAGISDQAIRVASKALPPELRVQAKASTTPLTTGSRTIYRARMGGFTEETAQKACAYLRNCMVIAP
jgi:D-alanyl-D-alanine carboxypeptidase